MALAAIAENGDLLVLDEVDVAVAIVIDAHGVVPVSYTHLTLPTSDLV